MKCFALTGLVGLLITYEGRCASLRCDAPVRAESRVSTLKMVHKMALVARS